MYPYCIRTERSRSRVLLSTIGKVMVSVNRSWLHYTLASGDPRQENGSLEGQTIPRWTSRWLPKKTS